MIERRRWGRIKVPEEKISIRVDEPAGFADQTVYTVDNINAGGMCFISSRPFSENMTVKLSVKFPFGSFDSAAQVWARTVYQLKIHNQEKYVIGIAFIRKQHPIGEEARVCARS